MFKVNYKDLKAEKVVTDETTFNASDLANGNFLLQKEADASSKFDVSKSVLPAFTEAADSKVYPNPATTEEFNVLFDKQKAGKYTMLFTDLAGRALFSKVVSISKSGQVENVRLINKTPKGTYLLKVYNEYKQLAFSEKVMLQ